MSSDVEKLAMELAARPYTEVSFRDRTTTNDYIYVAITPELDGCVAQGETMREALENLRLFRVEYIQHLLENNLNVPDPEWMETSTGEPSFVLPRHDPEQAQVKVENDKIAYA
jgi:predicted RNase H-like HicB family nuclease